MLCLAVSACGGSGGAFQPNPMPSSSGVPGQIHHIVIIFQENRSVDNLFNGFPGADTVQSGMDKGAETPLTVTPLGNGPDLDHTHTGWWKQWDHGKMDN